MNKEELVFDNRRDRYGREKKILESSMDGYSTFFIFIGY